MRAGLPTAELAQKAPRVEADGVEMRVCACTALFREAVLLGCMWLLSLHLRVHPIAQSEEHVSFSLFLKFLRLEIMYFSWPEMKARE